MKTNYTKWIITLLFLPLTIFSQNVSIDYSTMSNSNCVFNVQTDVGGVIHQATIGQPKIINNVLALEYYSNNGTPRGTEYQIFYNFKAGYSYEVKINASTSNVATPTGLSLAFGNNGSSSACNGDGLIVFTGNSFGSTPNQAINSGNQFIDFTYSATNISSAESSLRIATYSGNQTSPSNQTVKIKKVTIIETPPPPTFTISPNPVSIPCGSVAPVTFTYSNVYNTPNVTYNFSYGGWTFVSSTANSITLKPTNGTILPSNFSLIPIVNGVTQNYVVSTVIRAPYTSSGIISGDSGVCSSSVYSVTELQTGETVQWSI